MTGGRVFDAIVVGSGPAGSWSAKVLTEHGLDVLVLEAGRQLDDEKDFPNPPRSDSRSPWVRAYAALRHGQMIQAACPAYMLRTRHLYVNDRDNPYSTPRDRPFLWFRGRQVGGRMHTFARMVPRMSDYEFKAASRDGIGIDWPISYADLAPYYDRVESFHGVHGSPEGLDHLPDGKFIGPFPFTAGEQKLKKNLEERFPGRHVLHARTLRYEPGARVPPPLAAASRSGKLSLRQNSVVRHIELDPQTGRATGVVFVDSESRREEVARGHNVVLCASTIETLRILLNSKSSRHPNGLGNDNGLLGRFVTEHLTVGAFGEIEESETIVGQDPYDFSRMMGFYVPGFRNIHDQEASFRRSYGLQGFIGRNGRWAVMAFGEMLPRFENHVATNGNRLDAWDIPIAQVDCSASEQDQAKLADQRIAVSEFCEAAGVRMSDSGPVGGFFNGLLFRFTAGRLSEKGIDLDGLAPSLTFRPGGSIHEVGGARMGHSAEDSVVDAKNRVWSAPNVLVADGACMTTSGYQNTTLTIMALAARACDLLARDLKHG